MPAPQLPARGKWSTGICGCFEDCSNCWVTCLCPCLTFGRNAEIVDEGRTSAYTACGPKLFGASHFRAGFGRNLIRMHVRNQIETPLRFELPEQPCWPCGDCCVHHLCCFCALCQEHRELTNRQMDPRGGWRATYARIMNPAENRATPIPEPSMARN